MASPKYIDNKRTGTTLRAQVGRNGGLVRAFTKGAAKGGKPVPMLKQKIPRLRSVYKQMNRTVGRTGFQAAAKNSKTGGSRG